MRKTGSWLTVAVACVAVVAAVLLNDTSPAPRRAATPSPQLAARHCVPGASYMGCAAAALAPSQRPTLRFSAPLGCKIPDVSSWQGHPAWSIAKPYICGGIYKAGERYFEDPDASYNHATLAALGLWHTAYWFVRPGSCVAEAHAFANVLSAFHYTSDKTAGPPVLDEEVPGIAGYAGCMAKVLFATFHVWPVIYTAPGTWPGGSGAGLLAWPAAYGPSHPPCLPFTCSHYVAWQFGAPPFIFFPVPGLGSIDESVNYTFTSMRPFAGKPAPTPAQIQGWIRARNSSERAWRSRHCNAHLARSDCWRFGYQRALHFQTLIEHSGATRVRCFGPRRDLSAPKCVVVRPYVSRWSRLRNYYKAHHAHPALRRRYAVLVKVNLY